MAHRLVTKRAGSCGEVATAPTQATQDHDVHTHPQHTYPQALPTGPAALPRPPELPAHGCSDGRQACTQACRCTRVHPCMCAYTGTSPHGQPSHLCPSGGGHMLRAEADHSASQQGWLEDQRADRLPSTPLSGQPEPGQGSGALAAAGGLPTGRGRQAPASQAARAAAASGSPCRGHQHLPSQDLPALHPDSLGCETPTPKTRHIRGGERAGRVSVCARVCA